MFVTAVSGGYSNHKMTGEATWYGTKPFLGNMTPSGIICDGRTPQIAHKTLPFGVIVKITNITNGRSTVAIVTDRGPYIKGRIVDFNAYWQINKICDTKYKKCGSVRRIKLEVVDDKYACKKYKCLLEVRIAPDGKGGSRKLGERLENDEVRELGLTWLK